MKQSVSKVFVLVNYLPHSIMENIRSNSFLILVFTFQFLTCSYSTFAQHKTVLFDIYHSNFPGGADLFAELLSETDTEFQVNSEQITSEALADVDGFILYFPKTPISESEKEAIISFINMKGSLFLVFDEERRTPSNNINDIIKPFGLELTENLPYVHNCGAIAEKSEVCAGRREIPFSGGRGVIGGNVISKVYMEGDHVHSAYQVLENGSKIMVMSDGMAALLMGEDEGVRLTGTKPADTRYWGKDSEIFMKEMLLFFLSN